MDDEPLAYFLTWTTYGTWLPGDDRWWTDKGHGEQPPDLRLRKHAQASMTESKVTLDRAQRELVDQTIRQHAELRGWTILALNCRTNHVHVVVVAPRVHPQTVIEQLKAWCSRRLKEQQPPNQRQLRTKWWTEGSSQRWLNREDSLEAAMIYVRDCQ